jgi:hypothetical protein
MSPLCTLVKWSFASSSLQATIPFTLLPDLNSILDTHPVISGLAKLDDQGLCFRMKSCLGQPVVLDILRQLRLTPHMDNSVCILQFLSYLCRNVAFCVPQQDFLMHIQAKVSACYSKIHTSQVPPSNHVIETDAQRSERIQSEIQNGVLYWGLPQVAVRARYEMDKKATSPDVNKSQESLGCEEGCGKKFSAKSRHTGCEFVCVCVCVRARVRVQSVVCIPVLNQTD